MKTKEYTTHSETIRKVAMKPEQAWDLLEQAREKSVKPISVSPVYRFYKYVCNLETPAPFYPTLFHFSPVYYLRHFISNM
jgi:hypothetical protein